MATPITDKEYNQRTQRQNRALHKYFEFVADELNDAGLDMRTVLKPGIEIPWSKMSVKEYLWKPVMAIQLQKKSTVQMTTKDIDTIYDTLNRFLALKGLHTPFPSIEAIMAKQLEIESERKKYAKKTKTEAEKLAKELKI